MSRTVSMANLRSRCQIAADQEGQSTISDSTWNIFIDRGLRQLYAELAKPGVGYFDDEETITADGTADYPLPSDHLWTVGVDYVVDAAGRRRALRELMRQERNMYSGLTGQTAVAYEVIGQELILYPTPPSGQTYQLVYIPQPPDVTSASDGTLLEMATPDGEDFLIWCVVFFARDKLEQDTRTARDEREAARLRVAEDATLRAFQHQKRRIVQDDDDGFYDPASFRWNPP